MNKKRCALSVNPRGVFSQNHWRWKKLIGF